MKAQTHYRCKNCGRIETCEAGKQLSSCPDCGSGSLQILVPVNSEKEANSLSVRTKASLAALIGFAGVASIIVFLLFGRLLQEYITFDAGREAAEKARERLSTEIQAQEATLTSLNKKAAEELTRASENARQVEASANSAKATVLEAENALQRTRFALSNETARVAGVRTELAGLEDDRSRLRQKVEGLTAEEARLSAAVQAAVSFTNRLSGEVQLAAKAQATASADLIRIQTELDTATSARDKAREQLDEKVSRVSSAVARREALEAGIRDMEKTQAAMEAAITELKRQNNVALAETAKTRAAVDALNTARDKAREEADAQSARAATLKAEVIALEQTKADAEKLKGVPGK